jgi:hypothetical protein
MLEADCSNIWLDFIHSIVHFPPSECAYFLVMSLLWAVTYNGAMTERITPERRESVFAEGKQAFGEYKGRGYNPYAANNQELAMIWWHGWDTAEEESKGGMTRPGGDGPS